MAKQLDLDTATREQLVAKIHNLREEVRRLQDLNRRGLAEHVRLSETLRQVRKLTKGY